MTRRPSPKSRSFSPNPSDLAAGPGWRWRTLPVWVALTGGFSLGFEIASLGVGLEPSGWSRLIGYAGLLAFGIALSRLWSWYVSRWVMRRQARTAKAAPAPARGPGGGKAKTRYTK